MFHIILSVLALLLAVAVFAHPLDPADTTIPLLSTTTTYFQNATLSTATPPPGTTSSTGTAPSTGDGNGVTGYTVGTAVGGAAGGVIIIVVIVFWCRARKRRRVALAARGADKVTPAGKEGSEKSGVKAAAASADGEAVSSGTALEGRREEKGRALRGAVTL